MSNFTINDIPLTVAPSDIRATNRRNIGTTEFIRDNSSYAFKTKHNYTAYNIILQFNLNDDNSFEDLVKLSTQLDIYPFCFIKSDRLDSLIPHYFDTGNKYNIWGISQVELIQSFDAPNIITMVLEVLYFNYLPIAKSFSFVHMRPKRDQRMSPVRGGPRPVIDLSKNKEARAIRKNSPVDPDTKKDEVSLFEAYFRSETAIKRSALSRMRDSVSSVFIRYPEITKNKPKNFGTLEAEGKAEKINISNGDLAYKTKAETIYIEWKCLEDKDGNEYSYNGAPRAIQSIVISRRNNFAEQYLSAWSTPVLQYIGRGQTEVSISTEYDIGLNPTEDQTDASGNPLDFIKHSIRKIEDNYVNYRAYDSFNNLKIKSFVTEIMPSYSYVVNAMGDSESATSQGVRSSNYNLFGTDTRSILKRSQFNKSGTVAEYTLDEKIDRIIEISKRSTSEEFNSRAVQVKTRILKKKILIAKFGTTATGHQSPDKHSLESLLLYIKSDKNRNDVKQRSTILDDIFDLIDDIFLRIDREKIERLREDPKNNIAAFKNEAVTDMKIGERLNASGISLEDYGINDTRDLGPFFFLEFVPHLTFEQISRTYDYVNNNIEDESIQADIERIQKDRVKEVKNIDTTIPAQMSSKKPAEEENLDDLFANEDIKKEVSLSKQEYPYDLFKKYDTDPFGKKINVLHRCARMAEFYRDGLNIAFPVIKVFLVVSNDKGGFINALNVKKNEYFELSGISALELVTNDDTSPVDYLEFTIANPGSCYTDEHVMFENDPIRKSNSSRRNTETNLDIEINQMRLMPGIRLHVKCGYSNNINELETIFNGVVTDIAPFDDNETILRIAAEGMGRELIAAVHGDKTFLPAADTYAILKSMLVSEEIENFGGYKFPLSFVNANLRDPEASGILKKLENRKTKTYDNRFTNVYINAIRTALGIETYHWSISGLMFFNGKHGGYEYLLDKTTPWDTLKEMEFRHPGMLSKPTVYGDRMSYFFGIKEQLYVHMDFDLQKFKKYGVDYNEYRHLRFKPVSDYHMITSDTNIIFNGLRVSSDFNTVVNVEYYDDVEDYEDLDYEYYRLKADDNLRPSDHREGLLNLPGIDGERLARIYGMVYLRKEIEKMYDGKIVLIGNKNIKAGDYCSLFDDIRGLSGIIKVRECHHILDMQTGWITVITPGLYAEESIYDFSNMIERLFAATAMAQLHIKKSFANSTISIKQINQISRQISKVSREVIADNKDSHFSSVSQKANPILRTSAGVTVRLIDAATRTEDGSVFTEARRGLLYRKTIGSLSSLLTEAASAPVNFWIKSGENRQPLMIMPLTMHGKDYVGGISGYKNNGRFQSFISNYAETGKSIGRLFGVNL